MTTAAGDILVSTVAVSHSVPEYWVVNVADALVEVHTEPVRGAYTRVTPYRAGDVVRLGAFPDVGVGDILP